MASDSIRLLTYNIHKGMSASHRRFVLHAIREELHRVDADVVLLQEVQGEHFGRRKQIRDWPDNNQTSFLSDSQWPFQVYAKNAVYRRGHHGNAILSKFPIKSWENIDVSLTARASRSLLHTVVAWPQPDSRLHIICVHLGLFGFERERQLSALVERVVDAVPPQEPVVIAGDFNDWRSRAGAHLHDGFGLEEVFMNNDGRPAKTFPAWLPLLRMDRVYSRGLSVKGYEQLRGKPWQRLSDHIPLLAEFALAA